MDKIKNALKIAGIYTGLVIGAGFASGREVIAFFTSYGSIWPVGMVFTGILLSVLGWMILTIIEKEQIHTYKAFLKAVMGEKMSVLTEVISGMFLCVLFFAMVAASGSLLNEAFGIERIWGSIALSVMCLFIFRGGMDKLININTLLSPFMVIGTAVVCLITYFTKTETVMMMNGVTHKVPLMIFFSAVIYVSYNIISSVSIFAETGNIIRKDKNAKYGAVIGGGVMVFLGLMMGAILLIDSGKTTAYDIPVLAAISGGGFVINYIYILVILGAIITTAVGNGYGAVKWIESDTNINSTVVEVFLCVSAVIFSFAGFAQFTDKVYPLFGFMGLAEMFCIFKYFLTDK
ncbi:MAG: hypothetical protein E7235_03765 [Lachnospiraceae bacterium]|nr:hypothetical protein [Lachnospiraceae bacterium]